MRGVLRILGFAAAATMLHGCTAMFNSSSYGGDLYRTDNRVEVANRLRAEAEAQRAEADARRAQWEARQAEAEASRAEAEYYASIANDPDFNNIVANDYQSAYARRLYGFNSPSYRVPSSYYDYATSNAMFYATAYDPSFYNVMVSGNQVWVEPKYITSMFGSWGATNITFGIYASPWNYGWSYRVNPFYYSWWGYPRYSWYDWNWTICYNPWYDPYDWWYGNYYDPFHHHHHHHNHPPYAPPRPPQHRPQPGYGPDNAPAHGPTGSGASSGPNHNLNGNRANTADRYTSPTTNRNYGSSTHSGSVRPSSGTTSSGIYQGNDRRPGSGTSNGVNIKRDEVIHDMGTMQGSTRYDSGISTTGGSSNKTGGIVGRPAGSSNSSLNNKSNTGSFRQGTSSSRTNISSGSSNSSSNRVSGGSTSTRRGNSSSSFSSSSSHNSSYTPPRSTTHNTSGSSYRSGGSSSRSGSSGGFSSGGGSRSGGGGSTSSRR